MSAKPLLCVDGLTRHFGNLAALQDVNLCIEAGERCAIIGPNGAGKTTLFNLITGELPPTSGQVWFQGRNITRLPPHVIAGYGLARSFQLNNLFPDFTVYDNVRLAVQARTAHRDAMLRSAARLPGIDRQVQRVLRQIGLQDQAYQVAASLSYGDQRHLEIGLALAVMPTLLLLDEPTSGMSPLETQNTVSLINNISDSLTLVLIEHDMDVVMSVCDRIVVMHYGQVLAEGTPQQIAQNEQVQEAYFGEG